MHAAVAAVTPTPAPTVDPELVTPGPWGFVVIALLALAVILLLWDMLRRIRRGRVRADIAEELEAERLLAEAGDGAGDRDEEGAAPPRPDDGGEPPAPRA